MRFEIYQEDVGTYRWRLFASDGQLMATSKDRFSRHDEVKNAVVALQASIPIAKIIDGVDRRIS
jgi:uncharacterized protein YegP (UPF0339 family)